jgi:hypothetical protein
MKQEVLAEWFKLVVNKNTFFYGTHFSFPHPPPPSLSSPRPHHLSNARIDKKSYTHIANVKERERERKKERKKRERVAQNAQRRTRARTGTGMSHPAPTTRKECS